MKGRRKKNLIRETINNLSQKELSKLALDLYSLSPDNTRFIESRFGSPEETLRQYKEIISGALYPDIYSQKPVRLSSGKKAISDYFKATKDRYGRLELMVHYLEMGNRFTVDYGDINDSFYNSLGSMMEKILKEILTNCQIYEDDFLPRIEAIVRMGSNIGWGYSDTMGSLLEEYKNMKTSF